ncbi:phage recombination protein Bet [Lysobacter sp. GCM10012299]|uniref:phage recombination protein Bet n=1 Tax=Lysobacter sp. GCM10012299 TaxID=3317333 RepID=UPI003605CBD7
MNAIARTPKREGALVTGEQAEAIRRAMKSSLYPGANEDSIDMVLAYCQAAGLDPMTKPVHIVPMKVSTGRKDERGYDIKEDRDVVMPGIGLYRINAARTGQYAGCSEPEFGPTCTMEVNREVWEDGANGRRQKRLVPTTFQYPEWCRVTVRKLLGSQVVEFSAKEYWIENYASKGDGGPNAMWEKRAFGQLAKCTEAQALRKAFPEAVGSQPTAEEMEGKDVIEVQASRVSTASTTPAIAQELPLYSEADFAANLPKWWHLITSGRKNADDLIAMLQTKARFTVGQLKEIRNPPKEGDEVGKDGGTEGQA